MTSEVELLGNVIEFSIGLAGFSAVVSVFLQRSSGLADIDRVRVQSLLMLALTPAFIAFVFTGIETAALNVEFAARVSSAFLVVLLIGFSIYLVRSPSTLPPDQLTGQLTCVQLHGRYHHPQRWSASIYDCWCFRSLCVFGCVFWAGSHPRTGRFTVPSNNHFETETG